VSEPRNLKPMSPDEAVRLLLARAEGADRVVLLYPRGDQTACSWYGMSAEQAVEHLYQCADEILRQCVPLKGVSH
jgi:hypothetical protein